MYERIIHTSTRTKKTDPSMYDAHCNFKNRITMCLELVLSTEDSGNDLIKVLCKEASEPVST